MAAVGDRPRQNGSRKFTADIIKQLKEMTNAADEDIQMALQECNGDVNRAAMFIIDNPFQEVKNKKVKPKVTEKPLSKPPPRDFPQRERREYVPGAERPDRFERSDQGRGRDERRGGRAGGRAGRGRGFRDGDAPSTLPPGSRPIPAPAAAPAVSESIGTVPRAAEYFDAPGVQIPAQAPASPPKPPSAAPAAGGLSWASKLKPSPALAPQPDPAPEPAHAEIYAEPEATNGWGIPAQHDPRDAVQQADDVPDDAFGNGFSHRGEPEAAASWGPPAPGDATAQWGSPAELAGATLDEAVAKSFTNDVPSAGPAVPNASSPSYGTQHQAQAGNFDFSGMAASLNSAGYGSDPKYGGFHLPRKDAAQPAASMPYPQASIPQANDYGNAFNVFQSQPADAAGAADDGKPNATHAYMPPGVPGFAQYSQPAAFPTPGYGGLSEAPHKQQDLGGYAVNDAAKHDGYGLPAEAAVLEQKPAHEQRGDEPAPQGHPPHMQHDMSQFGLQAQSPEMAMYGGGGQGQRGGAAQQPAQQPHMGGQPGVGLQQPQSQAQMASFIPQQAGMPGYGNYGNPNMPYSAMPGFPGSSPYGAMPGYGMQYPPGAYPQYAYQGQSFPAQQPPAPYAAAPGAYAGKPAYEGGYPQAAGGRNGGRRNKNKGGFGRGAGGAQHQGMGTLLNEGFNPAANPQSTYQYVDPAWNARSYDAYKPDKGMPAQQGQGAQHAQRAQQYEGYNMQQSFQPAAYSGAAYSSQQFANPGQYSNQWAAGQDKSGGYPKYS